MKSKFPGTCRDCHSRISRGETIQYHGRSQGVSCEKCIGDGEDEEMVDEDEAAGFERGTLANDRRLARSGLTVVRTAYGTYSQNSRGRCEDAPCCGCCSF